MTAARDSEAINVMLAQILSAHFDQEELRTLCFNLSVPYDDLPAEGKTGKARELVLYLDRRDRILECIETVKKLRPDISWSDISEASQKQPPLQDLPPKTYDRFIGRAQDLEKLMAALCEPAKHRLSAIYGMGGIGKTALVRQAADQSLRQGRFEQIVWVSGKTEKFEGVGVERVPVSDLTFESLLDRIARQCCSPDPRQPPTDKRYLIQAALASRPILIVLDNLETLGDYESFVSQVDELVRGQSKAVLTSRHQVKHTDVYAMLLGGLTHEESILFLQEEGHSRGVTEVMQAPRDILSEIYRASGGAPLAMKLVIGQLSRQPLDIVLRSLKQVSSEGQDYEFYRFIFKHSWDLLSMTARQALVAMSVFDPATGGPVQMVRQVSQVDEAAFYPAMDDLITLSLVDFGGGLGSRRYSLHQLTYYFILSDIVNKWG